MQAIVLVAGKGTRLRPLTQHTHKCLTKVRGVPILYNTLNNLKKCGVQEVILVVGYLAEQIQHDIGENWQGLNIRYAHNNDYENTNTSASLLSGLKYRNPDVGCLVLEGDVFFEEEILRKLLHTKSTEIAATVLERYNAHLDGTFVELSPQNYVTDWIHKSARSQDFVIEDKYKTVNIHYFSSNFINEILQQELLASVKEYAGSEAMEFVLQRIVKKYNSLIKGIILEKEKWFEIDDILDLKMAEKIFE